MFLIERRVNINCIRQNIIHMLPFPIHEVYVTQFNEIQEAEHFTYRLSHPARNPATLACSSPFILTVIAHHIGLQVERDIIEETSAITFPSQKRATVMQFLNKARFMEIPYVNNDKELQFLAEYLKKSAQLYRDNIFEQIKIIIKVAEDIDYSDSQPKYVIFFNHDHFIREAIASFSLEEISASEYQNFYIKLRMIQNQGRFSAYKQKHIVFWVLQEHELIVYGSKQEVQFSLHLLKQDMQRISKKVLRGNQNFMEKLFTKIGENYGKIRIQSKTVYYFQQVEDIFQEGLLTCKLFNFKDLFSLTTKDIPLKKFCQECSQFAFFNQNNQIVFGSQSAIDRISSLYQKIKARAIRQKQEETTLHKQGDQIQKIIDNIEVSDLFDHQELTASCSALKNESSFRFKIEFGEFIRISNCLKTGRKIYVAFSSFMEIFQLQTLFIKQVDFQVLGKAIESIKASFFREPTEVLDKNQQTIVLYPILEMKEGTGESQERQVSDLLQVLKKDSLDGQCSNLVCGVRVLELILQKDIDFMIKIIIDQEIPRLYFLNDIQKEKGTEDIIKGTMESGLKQQYENREMQLVKSIFQSGSHEYLYEDEQLTELDNFNIGMMFAEDLPSVCLFKHKDKDDIQISKSKEFVYFTYLNKTLEVQRDKFGRFISLAKADLSKDASLKQFKNMKPFIQRAFVMGQKYLSIKLPFSNIILLKKHKVKILRNEKTDSSILAYYKYKLTSPCPYRVTLKPHFTAEHFQQNFPKISRLRFSSSDIKPIIQSIELGYGYLKKQRSGNWVVIEASNHICLTILDRITQMKKLDSK